MSFVPSAFPNVSGSINDGAERESIVNRLKGYVSCKPFVAEFLNWKNFAKPSGLFGIQSRVRSNASYFRGNYTCILGLVLLYCLLQTPMMFYCLLFSSVFFLAVVPRLFPEGRDEIHVMGGRVHLYRQHVVAVGAVVGLPLLIWSSPLQFIFGFCTMAAVFVLPHAILYDPTYHTGAAGELV